MPARTGRRTNDPAWRRCVYGPLFQQRRGEAIERGGNRCAGCGRGPRWFAHGRRNTRARLEVHHVDLYEYPCGCGRGCRGAPPVEARDLSLLCGPCHRAVTVVRRGLRRGNDRRINGWIRKGERRMDGGTPLWVVVTVTALITGAVWYLLMENT